jgi:hypothetical protein
MSSSETILTQQSHPGDSTVETVTGDVYKGDGYYGRSDGFHTVQYTLDGFIGTVNIQATLAIEPTEDDWFTVYTQAYPVVNDEGTTASKVTNFTGNYVWIRAYISNWTDGTVENIKLNH